jgi:hypothetical protein
VAGRGRSAVFVCRECRVVKRVLDIAESCPTLNRFGQASQRDRSSRAPRDPAFKIRHEREVVQHRGEIDDSIVVRIPPVILIV